MRRVVSEQKRRGIYDGFRGHIAKAVDATVGLVAPRLAHEWRRARVRSEALLAFEAARVGRLNPAQSSSSADGEILRDLPQLRAQSRNLVQNDAHASSAVAVLCEAVVGDGIRPQSAAQAKDTQLSEAEVLTWRQECDAEWKRWVEHADASEFGTFYDMQDLALRHLIVDGELLGHAVIRDGEVRAEMIDPDRLESPNRFDTVNIRGGIELGPEGQRVAFHVLQQHPADVHLFGAKSSWNPDRIEAKLGLYSIVQHGLRRTQSGQTRGVPWFAPGIEYLRHLHHYLSSELIAARAASNYALFIKRSVSDVDQDIAPVQGQEDAGRSMDYHEFLEPGTVEYLNEGEEPVAFNPNRPGSAFTPFVERMLRAIAITVGLSYEVMTKDIGRMNLSSARAMFRECHKNYDRARTLLNRAFNKPWWRNVILAGVAAGRIRAPRGFLDRIDAFLECRWVAPTYGFVDPVTDVQGSRAAVENNLSTPQEEAARYGQDAERVLEERARFYARAAELERQYQLSPGTLTQEAPQRVESASSTNAPEGDAQDAQDTTEDQEETDGTDGE